MNDLRVAIIGAGAMGLDHIIRINERISGATVSVIIEPSPEKAATALTHAPAAVLAPSLQSAIDQGLVDAVAIVTPGDFHESDIMVALNAGLPIFCEKPLTTSTESALRICAAEEKVGKHLIQVGYTRRFDEGYLQLKEQIASNSLGELLILHCTHRNPRVPDWYGNEMLIADSVSHEFDAIRFLTGSPIVKVEVRQMKRNKLAPERLNEPILVLVETESGVTGVIEMNVSVQFGYQVITEAVFQKGIAEIGRTQSMNIWEEGRQHQAEHTWYLSRFAQAYDLEVQRWVNAARIGGIDGPSAWDGYMSVACVQAGLASMANGKSEAPTYAPRPDFYQ